MENLQHRREHRRQLLDKLAQHVLYDKACKWCPMVFPNKPPNMVKVQLPQSDGMCQECHQQMMEEVKEQK
jgi:hypothetical protein